LHRKVHIVIVASKPASDEALSFAVARVNGVNLVTFDELFQRVEQLEELLAQPA
jgi:hypothetical protein